MNTPPTPKALPEIIQRLNGENPETKETPVDDTEARRQGALDKAAHLLLPTSSSHAEQNPVDAAKEQAAQEEQAALQRSAEEVQAAIQNAEQLKADREATQQASTNPNPTTPTPAA